MAAQDNTANRSSSPRSEAALCRETKRIFTTRCMISKWHALCEREDDISTEVTLEAVDISAKEAHRLISAMGQRVLRHIAEYEDIGQQEHEMTVLLSHAKRRGSACSSKSADSVVSRESFASADGGDGGFKPWAKGKGVVEEESDVWQFGRSDREEVPSVGESANRQKEKRQPSTGTCAPQ